MRYQADATRVGVSAIRMLFLLLCVVSPCSLAAADDVALPRYRLEVGQELVYWLTEQHDPREANDAKNDKGKVVHNQMEWRIVVGRQNEDGSWRLYIRTKITLVNRDGTVRKKWDTFGYCDLHPDGSYSLDEQTAVFKRLLPYELFCRLPGTAAALEDGWKYETPGNRLFTYRVAERGRAHLQIAGTQHDDYSDIGKWQNTYTYDFDTERGLVVSIASEWKEVDTNQVNGLRTIRLTSSTRRDAAWVARFHEEVQRYLDVHAKWMAVCYEGLRGRTVAACKAARAKARTLLVAGREQAELEVLQELYDANIQAHDQEEAWMIPFVKRREEFFAAVPGFPTTWEAKNLDGSTFRLADHRGKVLVLFFWTTGTDANVLAAPQIVQLAADYQGKKDVAVLGMFVRTGLADEEANARYLIAKCFQGFPHLEAKDITALYEFRQHGLYYPTILVLDQAGRVQEAHVGYAGDLAQYIGKIVEGLRSKPPAKND